MVAVCGSIRFQTDALQPGVGKTCRRTCSCCISSTLVWSARTGTTARWCVLKTHYHPVLWEKACPRPTINDKLTHAGLPLAEPLPRLVSRRHKRQRSYRRTRRIACRGQYLGHDRRQGVCRGSQDHARGCAQSRTAGGGCDGCRGRAEMRRNGACAKAGGRRLSGILARRLIDMVETTPRVARHLTDTTTATARLSL